MCRDLKTAVVDVLKCMRDDTELEETRYSMAVIFAIELVIVGVRQFRHLQQHFSSLHIYIAPFQTYNYTPLCSTFSVPIGLCSH